MSGHEPGEMGLTAAELEVIALRNRVRELEAQAEPKALHEASMAVHCALGWAFDPSTVSPVSLGRAAEALATEYMRLRAEFDDAQRTLRNVRPLSNGRLAKLRSECDSAIAERDATQRALAESQAREQELRAALRKRFPCGRISHDRLTCDLHPGHDGFHESDDGARVHWPDSEGVAWAKLPDIISAPSDQTALREFGLKVANLAAENSPPMAPAEVVDAVLKGAP